MNQDDPQIKWRKLLEEAGLTDEYLLGKVNELLNAIQTGEFKPRNKEQELRKLKEMKEVLLFRIKQKQGG